MLVIEVHLVVCLFYYLNYRIVRSVWQEFPKFPKMASNEIEEGSAMERVALEETDYNSVQMSSYQQLRC